jgi:hypothetical protein
MRITTVQRKLTDILDDHLICHAFRHRMRPHSAQAARVVVSGAKVWDWELRCAGCNSKRFEIRDNFGTRVPGTYQTYDLDPEYRAGLGYSQDEYIVEIQERGLYY